ncbi:MAG: hypothetical protein JEZ04_08815 [Spirochaetales bacterium]|nr:hypothetical protein [Spirochaetales bacterium]
MNRMMKLIAAAAAALLFSCGNNPPDINQLNSQINLRKSPITGAVTAELLVLLNADDEDGDEDIETIYVIDDESGILWSAERGSWAVRNNRGMTWIGSERFILPYGELPAPGRYRVIVTDRGGERVEGTAFIPLVKQLPEDAVYPELLFGKDDLIEVKSLEKNNIVSFYDISGNLLSSFSITPGTFRCKDLNNGEKIFSEYRYVDIGYYNNSLGTGLIKGSYERRSE